MIDGVQPYFDPMADYVFLADQSGDRRLPLAVGATASRRDASRRCVALTGAGRRRSAPTR